MDYSELLRDALDYIESRVRKDVRKAGLCRSLGISEAHFQDVFARRVGVSPGRYIVSRKVANAAFELSHGDRKVLEIALDYGFDSHDSFTRAFKRITGYTPSGFRKAGIGVGRVRLSAGVYGPGIRQAGNRLMRFMDREEDMIHDRMEKSKGSCVLYGVRKVEYCYEESTPFPAALRSCLNYLGQEIRYPYLMAATGAAFRLRWHPEIWDGGNVDIMNVYGDPDEAFVRAFKAAGRGYEFLRRGKDTAKEEFSGFIKREIDAGRPVLALGIIGPPEACIVTGYRDGGDTLLGWNFFQDRPEFKGDSSIDESGYFVTSSWWENPDTQLLMAVGEAQGSLCDTRAMLENALSVLTAEKVPDGLGLFHWGGQAAYRECAARFADDCEFGEGRSDAEIGERLMCYFDVLTMVGEGRAYAAVYLRDVASELEREGKESPAASACRAAESFDAEFALVKELFPMVDMRWGFGKQAAALRKSATRAKFVEFLRKAADFDALAVEAIRGILQGWA
jgi:AraC-like DNA-binding protein